MAGASAKPKKLEKQRLEPALQRANWLLPRGPDRLTEDPEPKLAELVETQGRLGGSAPLPITQQKSAELLDIPRLP